jgi:hypothetical protein
LNVVDFPEHRRIGAPGDRIGVPRERRALLMAFLEFLQLGAALRAAMRN